MSGNGRPGEEESRVRVMLCHDFPVARVGLRAIVESECDMVVVGESSSVNTGLGLIEELKPDVVVTDLSVSGLKGLDAMRAAKNQVPEVKILVRAYQRYGEYFPLAMRAGADGYLTREAEPVEVVNAIRAVSRGQNYLDPSIVTLLVNNYVSGRGKGNLDDPYDGLTEREREILCLVATDHTNGQIAEILHLSKQTVHNIRARLMEKLGFHDRLQLLKYAIRRGIVSVEEM